MNYLSLLGLLLVLGGAMGCDTAPNQSKTPPPQPEAGAQTPTFGNTYTERKIARLLEVVKQDSQQQDAIAQLDALQQALCLEADAPQNTSLLFELNRQMSTAVRGLNARYALLFFKKAIAIGSTGPKRLDVFPLMGAMAGLYLDIGKPDSALFWYHQARVEAKLYYGKPAQASSLNNLGVFYTRTGQSDSALYYYNLATTVLGGIAHDSILYCSIRDNLAQEQVNKGNYASALPTYQFNDSIYVREGRWSRVLANRVRWLTAKQHIGLPIAKEIEALEQFVMAQKKQLRDEDILTFYKFAKAYFFKAQKTEAAQHFDAVFLLEQERVEQKEKAQMDLLINAFLSTQAIRFRQELKMYQLESEAARQSLRFTKLLTLLLLLFGGLGAGTLVFFLQRRKRELDLAHRLATAELRAKELEAQTMAQTLQLQKQDLVTVALHNTQAIDQNRRMVERLGTVLRSKENVEQGIRTLMLELQNQEQLGERTQLAQEHIQTVNAAFFQALKERFPSLTKTEMDLCGYLRAHLSNKEIAQLKNIAPSSVKMGKNRLRKKFGLGEDDDLEHFLQKIK